MIIEIIESGLFPDFSQVYRNSGMDFVAVNSMRKGLVLVKKKQPQMIVCEFIYQPTYSVRISNIESLIAAMDLFCPAAGLVVLADPQDLKHFEKLNIKDRVSSLLLAPVSEEQMRSSLGQWQAQ